MPKKLTVTQLQKEAKNFALAESAHPEPTLYGVSDGKAIGTYLEHKFQSFLAERYTYIRGSSAKGIDFPELNVDIKVTSIRQPQSSCPFKSARQKIYGLGYSLLIFVYDKTDEEKGRTGKLNMLHVVFVNEAQTADYQTTFSLQRILDHNGNKDDILGCFDDKNLPIEEIEAEKLANEILSNPPELGYLTISNALQWRLQYSRVIDIAGTVEGVMRIQ